MVRPPTIDDGSTQFGRSLEQSPKPWRLKLARSKLPRTEPQGAFGVPQEVCIAMSWVRVFFTYTLALVFLCLATIVLADEEMKSLSKGHALLLLRPRSHHLAHSV